MDDNTTMTKRFILLCPFTHLSWKCRLFYWLIFWAVSSWEPSLYVAFLKWPYTCKWPYTIHNSVIFHPFLWSRPNECPPSLVHLAFLIVRGDSQENLKTSFVSLFSEAANHVIITILLLSPKSIPTAIRVPFVPHPNGFSWPFILCG